MGKTSVPIDVFIAMKLIKDKKVTEASKRYYFQDDTWKDDAIRAQSMSDNSYLFLLKNGDFVVVE